MAENQAGRLMDKTIVPLSVQIKNLLGKEATKRLLKFESFLQKNYDLERELKFPFGNKYGWGYRYSHKNKLLCYVFFERNSFTVTITIGKSEVHRLYKELNNLLPKTKELWENRYPCGDGGWMHYQVENEDEICDIKKLISIKKKPRQR